MWIPLILQNMHPCSPPYPTIVYNLLGWNSHRIRTEHGQSPNQIYVTGLLHLRESGIVVFLDSIKIDQYGIKEVLVCSDK